MGALRSAWPRVRARADRRPVYGGYGTRRYHNTVGAPSSERERLSALRAENAWKTSARAGAEVFEKPSGARRDASRPFSAHATAENGTRARRDRSLARRDTALRLPPVRSSSLELRRGARARARGVVHRRARTHTAARGFTCRARPTARRTPLEVIHSRIARARRNAVALWRAIVRNLYDRRGAGRVHPRTGGRATRCAPRSLRSLRQTSVSFLFSPVDVARHPAAARRQLAPATRSRGWATRDESRERSARSDATSRSPRRSSNRQFHIVSLSFRQFHKIESRRVTREELSVRPSSRRLLCRRLARERARRAGPPER